MLHVFPGNDIDDLNQRYPCCLGGPLLSESDAGLVARCAEPQLHGDPSSALTYSPAPFPLRVAATRSSLAVTAWAGLNQVQVGLRERLVPGLGAEQREALFARLLASMRAELSARGIPLAIAVIPHRDGLEQSLRAGEPGHGQRLHARLVAIARSKGVPVADGWDLFEQALRQDRTDVYLGESDFHLSPAGHELYARWLATTLGDEWSQPASQR